MNTKSLGKEKGSPRELRVIVLVPSFHNYPECWDSIIKSYNAFDIKKHKAYLAVERIVGNSKEKGSSWDIVDIRNKRNKAMKRAREFRADFLIFVDDDMIVPENFITRLVEEMLIWDIGEEYGIMAGVTTPSIRGTDKIPDKMPETTAHKYPRDHNGLIPKVIAKDGRIIRRIVRAKPDDTDVDSVGMFGTIIRRKLFKNPSAKFRLSKDIYDTGTDEGLNRGFFKMGEDTPFCLNALENGWKIKQLPDLKLIHVSTEKEVKKWQKEHAQKDT